MLHCALSVLLCLGFLKWTAGIEQVCETSELKMDMKRGLVMALLSSWSPSATLYYGFLELDKKHVVF